MPSAEGPGTGPGPSCIRTGPFNLPALTYRSDKADGPTAGTQAVDPLEFLARLLTHVPDPGQVMTRYYGWYASRTRGIERRHDLRREVLSMHTPSAPHRARPDDAAPAQREDEPGRHARERRRFS
jgi:hypothetical protein